MGSSGIVDTSGAVLVNPDFDYNYTPVNDRYPPPAPGAHVVAQGDTLRGIALAVFGDASLWYIIADANGLRQDSDLIVGKTLIIPNKITNLRNSYDVFKPYQPGQIIGDTTPTLPDPPPPPVDSGGGGGGRCGGVATVLIAAVAVIATVVTSGAAVTALSSILSSTVTATAGNGLFALGAGALSGTLSGASALGIGIASAAIGGAVGSAVAQGVAIAAGLQDKFSWGAVAMGAIGSGVAAGLTGTGAVLGRLSSGGIPQSMAAGALGNLATQGLGVLAGAQDSFDWKSVAVSAIAAPIARAAGGRVKQALLPAGERFAEVGGSVAGTFGAGAVRQLVYGGKADFTSIAADAFGNALGDAIVDTQSGRGKSQQLGALSRAQEEVEGARGIDLGGAAMKAVGAAENPGLDFVEKARTVYGPNSPMAQASEVRASARVSEALGETATEDRGLFTRGVVAAEDREVTRMLARSDSGAGAIRQIDGYLDRLSRWSKEDVGPAFDYAILDAASQGHDGLGRFLTGLSVVATASADAVSGAAGLGRLFTSQDVRETVVDNAKTFLADPGGSISRAYDAWTSKAWHEQLEDVYKVFQSGAAGIGLAGKAKGLFAVRALDDFADLGPNTQRVLTEYQKSYDLAAANFERDLAAQSIKKPDNLNFTTWAGGRIDNEARGRMNAFQQLSGIGDLIVNKRLYVPDGIKDYRIPDLFVPGERTVIDGTIGTKGLTTPQIQDFFNSGKVDRVILVAPKQNPVIITLEQFLRSKD